MGVCETLSEFKPVMHWQSQQQQDRHQHMLIAAYDPSRDLSPNLPITTSSCQQQESMNSLSASNGSGGVGGASGQSCRNASGSKSGCSAPASTATCGKSRITSIGGTPCSGTATTTPMAMCCGGFKEEYEPSTPPIHQSPHQHQQQQQHSTLSSYAPHGDCKDCVAAAVAAAATSSYGNQPERSPPYDNNNSTAASSVTVICKTEDCRSYSSSPVSVPPPTDPNAAASHTSHPFYDYSLPSHHLHNHHHHHHLHHQQSQQQQPQHQQRSPIDYHPVHHQLQPSASSSSLTTTSSDQSLNIRESYHNHHHNHYPNDPISPGGGSGGTTVEEETLKICAGCGRRISDRFYLYAVDRHWHVSCLQCSQCARTLDDEVTCFARDGNIYCRKDYQKLFGVNRCSRCKAAICSTELVMRAKEYVFHLPCFVCIVCMTVLHKGDQFGMRGDGQIYCRLHYESLLSSGPAASSSSHLDVVADSSGIRRQASQSRSSVCSDADNNYSPPTQNSPRFLVPLSVPLSSSSSSAVASTLQTLPPSSPPPPTAVERRLLQATVSSTGGTAIPLMQHITSPTNESKINSAFFNGISISSTPRPKGRPRKRKPKDVDVINSNLDSMNSDSYMDLQYSNGGGSNGSLNNHHHHHQRTKRMRTSFKHHQLRTMKTYFTLNHNPDAKDLKQLSQKTGLAKRVLQVWFQNARAKWRRMMNKQDVGGVIGNPMKSMEEKSCSESSGSTMESVYHSGSLSLGGHSPQEYMSPSPLDCNSS